MERTTAISLLTPERLPKTLLRDLAGEPAGIGRVLLNNQIENRREILVGSQLGLAVGVGNALLPRLSSNHKVEEKAV